jgi:hypothetical protein
VIAPVGRAVDRVRHVDPGDDNADEERRTAADHRTRRR